MYNDQKSLPLGTIVTVSTNPNKLMIIGYNGIDNNSIDKKYDYKSVVYPSGLLPDNHIYMFNNNDIIKTIFKGYENNIITSTVNNNKFIFNDKGQLIGINDDVDQPSENEKENIQEKPEEEVEEKKIKIDENGIATFI